MTPRFMEKTSARGVKAFVLESRTSEVVQIEFFFEAGRWFEHKKMVAAACAYLIKEGTHDQNAYQLAEQIEYYGASVQTKCGNDYASVSLYCLSRFVDQLVDIVYKFLREAAFPSSELSLYISRKKEGLKSDLSHASVVGYRELTEMVYGADHPYGYNSSFKRFEAITQEDLVRHHALFSSSLKYIFITGQIDDTMVETLLDKFDTFANHSVTKAPVHKLISSQEAEKTIPIAQSLQTSLYLGRLLPKFSPISELDFMITNVIFGGYFGSRLMKSIREVHGYSYGISSYVQKNSQASALIISTDIDHKYLKDTIHQIQVEVTRLCQEPITDAELRLVKNYIMGSFLQQFNGQLKSMRTLKRLILNGKSIEQISQMVHHLNEMTPQAILKSANDILSLDHFKLVKAG